MNQTPLETWKQKLAYLHEQEAISADPSVRFQLQEQIKECEGKIAALGRGKNVIPSNMEHLKQHQGLSSLWQRIDELGADPDEPSMEEITQMVKEVRHRMTGNEGSTRH